MSSSALASVFCIFVNLVQTKKASLRSEMKRRTAALTPEEKRVESANICEQLGRLPEIADSSLVLAFASLPDEPNLDLLWSGALPLALPRVDGEELQIWKVPTLADLQKGAFGIREPDPELCSRLDPSEIDTVLVPGMAFDKKNLRRLGRGGGFYDRFLANSSANKIGICFQHQLVDEVPCESHDCSVDQVVSGLSPYHSQKAE